MANWIVIWWTLEIHPSQYAHVTLNICCLISNFKVVTNFKGTVIYVRGKPIRLYLKLFKLTFSKWNWTELNWTELNWTGLEWTEFTDLAHQWNDWSQHRHRTVLKMSNFEIWHRHIWRQKRHLYRLLTWLHLISTKSTFILESINGR